MTQDLADEGLKLYDVPRGSLIIVEGKVEFVFEGVDGMYGKLRPVLDGADLSYWSAGAPVRKVSTSKIPETLLQRLAAVLTTPIETWEILGARMVDS